MRKYIFILILILIFPILFYSFNLPQDKKDKISSFPTVSQESEEELSKFETTSSEEVLSEEANETDTDNSDISEGCSVTKVIDGDTIDVEIDGNRETLRLIGVDTPETVDPRKPVQCFGREASEFTKSKLSGKEVILEADPTQGERDKYGRLLRYVFLDEVNFNELLIKEGYAHEYTYNFPYKYQKEFKNAESFATENKKGLWADDACDTSSLKQTQTYQPQGTYTCNCQKLCGAISSCDEAYYQLQNCGCSARDSDGDGVPCESLCR